MCNALALQSVYLSRCLVAACNDLYFHELDCFHMVFRNWNVESSSLNLNALLKMHLENFSDVLASS